MQCLHNALIRTHHITSRKKVAKLKQAATFHDVFVLLRSGGAPGVMYVEGKEDGVNQWVSDVQVSRGSCCLSSVSVAKKLTCIPEPAIQGLSARLSHRRHSPRDYTRRPADETGWSIRKRHCQRFWLSDAAAWCLCLVERRHGIHRFVRQNMKMVPCKEHLIAHHRTRISLRVSRNPTSSQAVMRLQDLYLQFSNQKVVSWRLLSVVFNTKIRE